ncbi:hypothetical protein [Algicella marina]|uniref:Uncharacterized protein n=1 Tax=Algicella marina TaxID=2683284 RepID=A0A6P1SXG9_9RHOB|nr:hypothetical protein [Algicella marina]QHQ34457.1 hypothetical protein GO499_04285 [Algicella marina]
MSTETIKEDLLAASEASKEFIAEFFYAPMGVEASPLLTSVTLYGLLAILAFALYRISKPAPHPRYRKHVEYDFGRNK